MGFITLIIGGFGALCTGFGVYAVGMYARYSRYPLREPTEVSTGDVVGMEGTVADSSPRITAPISGKNVSAAHWRVDRRSGSLTKNSPWDTIEEGIVSADELVIECSGYGVLVEVPNNPSSSKVNCKAFNAGLQRSETDFHELVKTDEEPSSEVKAFEERVTLHFDIGDRKKRFMEAQIEPGDPVTVYGTVETTSGEAASASNLRITDGGDTFRITTEQRKEMLQKFLYGGVFGFIFGLPSLALAVTTVLKFV